MDAYRPANTAHRASRLARGLADGARAHAHVDAYADAGLFAVYGRSHQSFSLRMTQAVAELHDADRSTWWEALHRAERGETPSLHGPTGPDWLRRWEGSRPVPKRRSSSTWE